MVVEESQGAEGTLIMLGTLCPKSRTFRAMTLSTHYQPGSTSSHCSRISKG